MYHLSVFVHILSAVIWVGGMLFLALVAVPAARSLPPSERGALLTAIGRRFRLVGWTCIALLLVTGVIIAGYRGVGPTLLLTGQLPANQFGAVLRVKLVLVGIMVGLTLVHDIVLGPASARLLAQSSGHAVELARQRRLSAWTARLSALLALLIVGLAVALVRGLPR
jgi:uncharacterized membrane protein